MWTTFCLKRAFLLLLTAVTVLSLVLYFWSPSNVFKAQRVADEPSQVFKLSRTLSKSIAIGDKEQPAADGPSTVSPQLQTVSGSTAKPHQKQGAAGDVKCVHPPLDPYDPAIMQYYAKQPPVNCSSAMKEWVYVINGTFHISRDAIRQYGNITCGYSPIFRNGDYKVRYGDSVKPMLDGMPLQSDFFRVFCVSASGKTYKNFHASVAWNSAIMERLRTYQSSAKSKDRLDKHKTSPSSPNDKTVRETSFSNLSVFMLGFDAMSRMAWHRNLPKSHKYFTETLGAVELEGYNIIGDATAAALLPMFTGKKKEELPEARPGVKGAGRVDRYPFIWKEFSKQGYVTAFAQDRPRTGVFQVNMRGFRSKPTDYYLRSFYLAADKARLPNPRLCWGSKPRHVNFMNWFGSLSDMYKDFPKFFVGHYLELSHDHINRIQAVDDDLVAFLQELELKGHLNSTVLILFGDHGPRFSHIRQTTQGRLEERLPYFTFRFPPWFHKVHPAIMKNLRTNAKRLCTPLDIHATFQDILNYTNTKGGGIQSRAISLFQEIPKERTCTQAGVTPHWCACLAWQPVNSSDPLVRQAVATALTKINNQTQYRQSPCARLTLQEITNSFRYVPSTADLSAEWKWLKFENGKADNLAVTHRYRVAFKTLPGHGHFEVTCEFDVKSRRFSVQVDQISRINEYGSQADCILKSKPHLRPYCCCLK